MSENVNIILATDCGSTTTKAILIELIDEAEPRAQKKILLLDPGIICL